MATIFRGISFPFRRGTTSFPVQSTDAQLIKEDLTRLVMQARGERVMRRDVGSLALSYIFENSNTVLDNSIRIDLTSLISRHEPRVVVRNIGIQREETQVVVDIVYVVVVTGLTDQISITLGSP